jgi:hypothetical protein
MTINTKGIAKAGFVVSTGGFPIHFLILKCE